MKQPNENIARSELEDWGKQQILSIKRFPTGNHHYVYDASFVDGKLIVIRMAVPSGHSAMAGALYYNKQLRGLGLPLPKIHFSNLCHQFPYLIMDRLPGNDLGFDLDNLTTAQQKLLATRLIGFQRKVGNFSSFGRYGYSATPQLAPYASWSEVLAASLKRSKIRMSEAAIIDIACVEKVETLLNFYRPQLKNIPATPFLHDITTKNVIIYEGALSGIVDVDDLCYGDPLFHIALTQMAVLSQHSDVQYINLLLNAFGTHSVELLRLYTAICCIDFLSELGQKFNGNVAEHSQAKKNHLMSVLDCLLAG